MWHCNSLVYSCTGLHSTKSQLMIGSRHLIKIKKKHLIENWNNISLFHHERNLTLIFVNFYSVTALKPKAKKPSPFVMDHVLTVVIFPIMSCILGWPFMSGVPVRTIANTMALIKVDPHPPPGKPAEWVRIPKFYCMIQKCLWNWLILLGLSLLNYSWLSIGRKGLHKRS